MKLLSLSAPVLLVTVPPGPREYVPSILRAACIPRTESTSLPCTVSCPPLTVTPHPPLTRLDVNVRLPPADESRPVGTTSAGADPRQEGWVKVEPLTDVVAACT